MYRLRNIAMSDYQESVTTGQADRRTDGRTDRQTPDKVTPMLSRPHKNRESSCLGRL